MRTQAQIDASRANGAKSNGPITEEGKAASSRNAIRHGLPAQTVVVEGESDERYREQVEAPVQEFDPQTENEMNIVEKMATARWHQFSAWGLKTAALTREIRIQVANNPDLLDEEPAARAFVALKELADTSNSLHLLQRYDVTLDRAYYRALNELRKAQKERITKRTQAADQLFA